MNTRAVLEGHPRKPTFNLDELARCIEALADCGAACSACADAYLQESDVAQRVPCIQACLDCADVCLAALRVVSRPGPGTHNWERMLEACRAACEVCAKICEKHADAHCGPCAAACRDCDKACETLMSVAS